MLKHLFGYVFSLKWSFLGLSVFCVSFYPIYKILSPSLLRLKTELFKVKIYQKIYSRSEDKIQCYLKLSKSFVSVIGSSVYILNFWFDWDCHFGFILVEFQIVTSHLMMTSFRLNQESQPLVLTSDATDTSLSISRDHIQTYVRMQIV